MIKIDYFIHFSNLNSNTNIGSICESQKIFKEKKSWSPTISNLKYSKWLFQCVVEKYQ